MKKKKNEIISSQFLPADMLSAKKKTLLKKWLADMESNPEFRIINKNNLEKESAEFIDAFIDVVHNYKLPKIETKELKPMLEMLKKLSSSRISLGYTIRETAMYIFALRNCFNNTFKTLDDDSLNSFSKLLDFLGLITLENYNSSKDEQIKKQQEEIKHLRAVNQNYHTEIVAESKEMKEILSSANKVLNNNVSVLIQGETGTGKEVIARYLHFQGHRKSGPFIAVNCGAIPKDLMESELFGFEKGTFTGALQKKIGKFELADKGTLFLDEIGELSLDLQVKLLRVLQDKEIEPIGSTNSKKVDIRIVAATNKDLQEAITSNSFRSDLFYRLNVFNILIPPLRFRKKDIVPLAFSFMKKATVEFHKEVNDFSADAVQQLLAYDWPGNIRELENVVFRAVILTPGKIITSQHFSLSNSNLSIEGNVDNDLSNLDLAEKQTIANALSQTQGNISQTAKQLQISRTTLYKKAKKYNLT